MESVLHREIKNAFYGKALVAQFKTYAVRIHTRALSYKLCIDWTAEAAWRVKRSQSCWRAEAEHLRHCRISFLHSDTWSRWLMSRYCTPVQVTCRRRAYLTTLTISHSNVGAVFKEKILSTAGEAKV